MLVPDEIRRCVAFVYMRAGGRSVPVGTAVLLGQSIEGTDRIWASLVTARHVINSVGAGSEDDIVRVRFNAKNGAVEWVEIPIDDWIVNEDDLTNDIAIARFVPTPELDVSFWPYNRLATNEVIDAQHIGLGDEVTIAGLFRMHHGATRNVPIVRIGNIAAMPEEPVQTSLGAMDAYLIEARSIGGLSGSPVFVNVGQDRSGELKGALLLGSSLLSSHLFLLGILHGHWDVLGDAPDVDGLFATDGPGAERINVGIAIVTPASKVLEIWNHPAYVATRIQHEAQLRTGTEPTS